MPRKRRSPQDFADDDSEDDDEDEASRHPQRNAANARERARMRVLSKAFCRLKTTLPWVPADTKLSKLDTLRLATSYIAHLRAVVTDQPLPQDPVHKHPLTLTWPYSFHQPQPQVRADSSTDVCGAISGMERDGRDANNAINGNTHLWGVGDHLPIQPVIRDKDVSYYY